MTDLEFEKRTLIDAPVSNVFSWHERQGAVSRLTPPWVSLALVHHSGGIETGTQVHFVLKIFGLPFVWEAEHIAWKKNHMFRDHQVQGPFKKWVHTHGFEKVSDNRTIMVDHVTFVLPFGILGRLFKKLALKDLGRIFTYRHRVLKDDLETMPRKFTPLTILISGASGTIGKSLVPFLRTSGHKVLQLVRRNPRPGSDEISWDPDNGLLELDDSMGIDAVINLNGMDISRGRWTRSKKQRILSSRTGPTRLLMEKLAGLEKKPFVFICASAIGYYGNAEDNRLTERAPSGNRFISSVCRQWEEAAMTGVPHETRLVTLRIGIVLTPAGGALERLFPVFALGLGTRISHGHQYMSWVSMEDVLGAVHHILFNPEICGPVNMTAPAPVTNREFTGSLAAVSRRPAWFVLPGFLVRLFWGQMGKETLLDSARVLPEKLVKSGYVFRFPDIDSAMRHALGKSEQL